MSPGGTPLPSRRCQALDLSRPNQRPLRVGAGAGWWIARQAAAPAGL